ncbi:MAG TPA: VWA domain-containing protein [Candidatus Angelobacter sp.]
MKYRFLSSVLGVISVLILSLICMGQSSPPGAAPSSSKNIVNIFFTVDDGHGMPVPDLSQDSIQIREDGRPQTIQSFKAGSDVPLTLGVLLDTSGTMQAALLAEKSAAGDFLRKVIRPKDDLAFAISFDVTVDLLQDLTGDVGLLRSGMNTAKVNVGLRGSRAGGALNDAIYLAADEILSKQVGRKALVIFTSGWDQGSKLKLKDAIQAAQKADAVCYVVLFSRTIFGQMVNDLAEQTGGRVFTVRSVEKLEEALTQIERELHNQYSVGYLPDSARSDSGFHTIEITTKEGYKVRARKGYYARSGS